MPASASRRLCRLSSALTSGCTQVVSYPTMVFIRNNVSTTYTGTRDINHLKEFARGGYKGAPKEASAPLPPDPATWTLLQTSLALAQDFVLEMAASKLPALPITYSMSHSCRCTGPSCVPAAWLRLVC